MSKSQFQGLIPTMLPAKKVPNNNMHTTNTYHAQRARDRATVASIKNWQQSYTDSGYNRAFGPT